MLALLIVQQITVFVFVLVVIVVNEQRREVHHTKSHGLQLRATEYTVLMQTRDLRHGSMPKYMYAIFTITVAFPIKVVTLSPPTQPVRPE